MFGGIKFSKSLFTESKNLEKPTQVALIIIQNKFATLWCLLPKTFNFWREYALVLVLVLRVDIKVLKIEK